MYILDTNVISELFRGEPDRNVASWLEATHPSSFFVTAISKAESLSGLATMPQGRRKQALHILMHDFFERQLRNSILPFGSREAEFFAEIVAERRKAGRPIGEFDAQIASIARSNGFTVVTRNTRDFEHCGVELMNPWDNEA